MFEIDMTAKDLRHTMAKIEKLQQFDPPATTRPPSEQDKEGLGLSGWQPPWSPQLQSVNARTAEL